MIGGQAKLEPVNLTTSPKNKGETAKNDVTGDAIQTKTVTDKYRDGWDRIWGNKNKKQINTTKQGEKEWKYQKDFYSDYVHSPGGLLVLHGCG